MGPATPSAIDLDGDGRACPLMPGIDPRLGIAGCRRLLVIFLCLSGVTGCLPVLSLAAAALGGADESPAGTAIGPFDGASSSSQNRNPYDPAISDALDASEFQKVTDECKAKLPPAEPQPATGCVIRLACLPGAGTPMRLRLCAKGLETAQPSNPDVERHDWNWGASRNAETARAATSPVQASTSVPK